MIPDQIFSNDSTVSVHIPKEAVKDQDGNTMVGPFNFSFSIEPGSDLKLDISKKINVSGSDLMLKWTKVAGINQYDIYRSTAQTGTYTKIAEVSCNSYVDTNLVSGTRYYYKVGYVDGSGSVTLTGAVDFYYINKTVVGGTISKDTVWTVEGSPYIVLLGGTVISFRSS